MGDEARHGCSADPSHLTESVSTLLRWELQGGVWRVLGRDGEQVTIGLFTCDAGEEMDPASRRHLGNFPQSLTHAALVQAALALRAAP